MNPAADEGREYRRLFADSPLPMWIYDPETLRFLEVNETAVAQYGYSRDEFLSMTIADIRPAEDIPAFLDALKSGQGPSPRAPRPSRHRRKDGAVLRVWLLAQDVVFKRRPARLVIVQDLGEREGLTAELLKREQFLQSVVDAMPAIVFVKSLEGRFSLVNRAWERLTGLSREEAKVKTTHDLFPTGVADLMRSADLTTLDGEAQTDLEMIVPGDEGSRTYVTSRAPLRDEQGRIAGILGLAVEITERKRIEETLRKLTRAVEQSPVMIMITDAVGRIEYVNPKFTELTGFTSAEAVGQTARILKSGRTPVEFYKELWETIRAGREWSREILNRTKGGELRWFSSRISPLRDKDGRITHFVAVEEDISQRRSLEAQLLQAQKMEAIGRLAGGVSHDFNNLLGVITGYAELLQRDLGPEHAGIQRVEQIRRAADRAAGLTRQLLAFSRKQVLEPKVLDLNSVVLDAEKMLQRLIGEDVHLVAVLCEGLNRVKADPGQVEQVIMNLAVNGRDAMPTGGKLIIETANVDLDENYARTHSEVRPGPHAMLAVSDTGLGMDSETMSQVFEPFYTTKEPGKGTGLGLSTVFGIVKQSGGHVTVYSEVGTGTTFKVYLPRVEETGEPKTAVEAVAQAPPTGTETILLVEDAEVLREMMQEILEGAGYRVLGAGDPETALSAAEAHDGPIHIVVTDVILPRINGREVADRIQAVRPKVKVLYMSGYTDQAMGVHGVLNPGTHFLQKPFTTEALLRKVRETLSSAQPST